MAGESNRPAHPCIRRSHVAGTQVLNTDSSSPYRTHHAFAVVVVDVAAVGGMRVVRVLDPIFADSGVVGGEVAFLVDADAGAHHDLASLNFVLNVLVEGCRVRQDW